MTTHNETDANISYVQYDYRYVDYDYALSDTGRAVSALRVLFIVVCTFQTVCGCIILLTCVSRTTRVKSAGWYLFNMVLTVVIDGILVKPLMYTVGHDETMCVFIDFMSRILCLVFAHTLVCFNIETIATILAPRSSWSKKRKTRFSVSMSAIWIFNFALLGTLTKLAAINNSNIHICYSLGLEGEIALHILKNWLPGFVVICTTLAAIVIYVKGRGRGLSAYNHFAESSGEAINPGEWFICLIFVNFIFIVLDVVLYEMNMNLSISYMTDVILHLVSMDTRFLMPFAMLSLSSVRATIHRALCAVYRALVGAYDNLSGKKGYSRNGSDTQNQMLDMDAIDDQSL